MALGEHEAGLFRAGHEVGVAVDAAVAVGQAGEVRRETVQTVGGDLVVLPVPEGVEHEEARRGTHRLARSPEHAHDLALGETHEELAHPDDVVALGETLAVVEHVDGMAEDAIAVALGLGVPPRDVDLAGVIDDGDGDRRVVAATGERELAGVAPDVENPRRRRIEDEAQGLREGEVGVVVVEGEPALEHLGLELREAFVDRREAPQGLQARG